MKKIKKSSLQQALLLDFSNELGPYLDGNWHHYVFSFDILGAQVTIFVDKVIRATSACGLEGQELETRGFLFVGGGPVDDPFAPWLDSNLAVVAGKADIDQEQVYKGRCV